MLNWWHVLLVMLLQVLLPPKLADLEHLEPALITKHLGAELDHFTVNGIVRWNILH